MQRPRPVRRSAFARATQITTSARSPIASMAQENKSTLADGQPTPLNVQSSPLSQMLFHIRWYQPSSWERCGQANGSEQMRSCQQHQALTHHRCDDGYGEGVASGAKKIGFGKEISELLAEFCNDRRSTGCKQRDMTGTPWMFRMHTQSNSSCVRSAGTKPSHRLRLPNCIMGSLSSAITATKPRSQPSCFARIASQPRKLRRRDG